MDTSTDTTVKATSLSGPATSGSATTAPVVNNGKDEKTDKEASKKDEKGGLDKEPELSEVEGAKEIKLIAKDKKEFKVSKKQAFVSTLVKTTLVNDERATEVPLSGVTGKVLELIVQYMTEHKGVEPPIIEKPLRSKVMKDVCSYKWDADYIDKIADIRQDLYDLILAANYMDVKSLLHLGCAKVASLIKGQPLEKIKDILDPAKDKERNAANASTTTTNNADKSGKDEKSDKEASNTTNNAEKDKTEKIGMDEGEKNDSGGGEKTGKKAKKGGKNKDEKMDG